MSAVIVRCWRPSVALVRRWRCNFLNLLEKGVEPPGISAKREENYLHSQVTANLAIVIAGCWRPFVGFASVGDAVPSICEEKR